MIQIIKPGLLTSVQDLGRYGFQRYGVITSGAMDPYAHRIANMLVGNKEKAPTLEITLVGPMIEFNQDALIAICGGDLSPTIFGQPVQLWRPVYVKKGSILRFGPAQSGCRAYLAIAGGLQVDQVMGSSSTYLRAGLGGYKGRALQVDDWLDVGEQSKQSKRLTKQLAYNKMKTTSDFTEADWFVSANVAETSTIRVMKGRQFHWFSSESQELFTATDFQVSPDSDRMGYRLKGSRLQLQDQQEMLSEAVNFGTIQVPSDGNPIVLMADRQTTGGYPKIAQIAGVDVSNVAQFKPGDKMKFTWITHQQAQQLYLVKEKYMATLKHSISLKIGRG